MLKHTLAGILALAATAAPATEVYRVVEPDGTVRYSDKPPHRHARQVQLPPLSGAPPRQQGRKFYSAEALRAAARFAVSIESPTPGQRASTGEPLVAAASVMPGLVSGFRLVYLLDDRAVTAKPVEDLSLLLPQLSAGDYRLRIVLLDPQGQEIARSGETPFAVVAPN
jgi:hypothetical protein